MFFEDPVAAFRNIRGALAENGQLAFCCWQPRAVNPFMTVPAMAALELLPAPPEMPPRAPGPFAFEEAAYVEAGVKRAVGTTGHMFWRLTNRYLGDGSECLIRSERPGKTGVGRWLPGLRIHRSPGGQYP